MNYLFNRESIWLTKTSVQFCWTVIRSANAMHKKCLNVNKLETKNSTSWNVFASPSTHNLCLIENIGLSSVLPLLLRPTLWGLRGGTVGGAGLQLFIVCNETIAIEWRIIIAYFGAT